MLQRRRKVFNRKRTKSKFPTRAIFIENKWTLNFTELQFILICRRHPSLFYSAVERVSANVTGFNIRFMQRKAIAPWIDLIWSTSRGELYLFAREQTAISQRMSDRLNSEIDFIFTKRFFMQLDVIYLDTESWILCRSNNYFLLLLLVRKAHLSSICRNILVSSTIAWWIVTPAYELVSKSHSLALSEDDGNDVL